MTMPMLGGIMGKDVGVGAGGGNFFVYKGEINVAADFPTLVDVRLGWTYKIATNVTDNDATKTNTGQSFIVDDEIFWNGTDWTLIGAALYWARTGTDLTPYNSGDTVSVGNLRLSGNSLLSTDANGKITLNPNGIGYVESKKYIVVDLEDAINSGITTSLLLYHGTSGTPAIGIGTRIEMASDSLGDSQEVLCRMDSYFTDVIGAQEDAIWKLYIRDNGSTVERLSVDNAGNMILSGGLFLSKTIDALNTSIVNVARFSHRLETPASPAAGIGARISVATDSSVGPESDIFDLTGDFVTIGPNTGRLTIRVNDAGAMLDVIRFSSKGIYTTYGPHVQSMSSVIDVVAANGLTAITDEVMRVQSSTAGDATVTATPAIVAGTEGQSLTVMGSDDTKTVTLTDGNGLKLDNAQSFTLGLDDSIEFLYRGSNWVEQRRVDV